MTNPLDTPLKDLGTTPDSAVSALSTSSSTAVPHAVHTSAGVDDGELVPWWVTFLLKQMRRFIGWMVIALVVGAVVGLVMSKIRKEMWVARCTVLLVQSLTAQSQIKTLMGGGQRPNQSYASAILESNTTAYDVLTSLKLPSSYSVGTLVSSLKVAPTADGVLVLSYSDPTPNEAVTILREYLSAYRRYTDATVLTVAKNERVFLQRQLEVSNERLRQAEIALLDFERLHPMYGDANGVRGLASTAETELATARSELSQALAKRNALREAYLQSSQATESDLTLPTLVNDATSASLQSALLKAQLVLANLRTYERNRMPDVREQRQRVANIERQLAERIHKIASVYNTGLAPQLVDADTEVAVARTRVKSARMINSGIERRLRTLPEEELQHMRLKRALEIEDTRNRSLNKELQTAKLAEARQPIYLVVLDQPVVGPRMHPDTRRLMYAGAFGAAALFASLLISLGLSAFALYRVLLDQRKAHLARVASHANAGASTPVSSTPSSASPPSTPGTGGRSRPPDGGVA